MALQAVLDDLTPRAYRDQRRHDPKTFDRMTCALCHQMQDAKACMSN